MDLWSHDRYTFFVQLDSNFLRSKYQNLTFFHQASCWAEVKANLISYRNYLSQNGTLGTSTVLSLLTALYQGQLVQITYTNSDGQSVQGLFSIYSFTFGLMISDFVFLLQQRMLVIINRTRIRNCLLITLSIMS
jgi:hypothetical protein